MPLRCKVENLARRALCITKGCVPTHLRAIRCRPQGFDMGVVLADTLDYLERKNFANEIRRELT
jgi:hypothetical protein